MIHSILVFILFSQLQGNKVEIGGQFGVLWEKEYKKNKEEEQLHQFSLHFGILNFIARPSNNLELTVSHDFVGRETRKLYAEVFLHRIMSNIRIGKFDPPFGLPIADHTSLLEDNIQLGRQRPKVGMGISIHPSIVELNVGRFTMAGFTPEAGSPLDLLVGTLSIRPWIFDLGYGYYSRKSEEYERTLKEFYAKMFIRGKVCLLGKQITGVEIYGPEYKTQFNGYLVEMKVYPHRLVIPYIRYEQFSREEDKVASIISGVTLIPMRSLFFSISYYANYEKEQDIENNFLAIMTIVRW
ncbi:MAG: hypothetical protein HY769_01095 [Candidatus Stahlbacteria bacterium]|nr:hypothetical protein [Candidatus Stahlbacteria bacterium]